MAGEPNEPVELERPRKRADCQAGGPLFYRPCPFISCRHHLATATVARDAGNAGAFHVLDTFVPVQAEPAEVDQLTEQIADQIITMGESCTLDIIDRRHECSLQEVGDLVRRTRERVRQIEQKGLKQIQASKRSMRRLRDE